MSKSNKGKENTKPFFLPAGDIARLKDAKHIGILGGTFDPIHYGHLAAAERVRGSLGLDVVVFLPSGVPAFKKSQVSEAGHRYAMTRLACKGNPYFYVSEAEIKREGTSYTIDTAKLFAELTETKTTFILGADAFMDLLKWHKHKELLQIAKFAVVTRPGTDFDKLDTFALNLKKKYGAKVKTVPIPALALSSTEIREFCAKGESIRYLLPDNVARYIQENMLYSRQMPVDEMRERLRKCLPGKRFAHSVSVADCAARLALIHGANEEKAYIAGLLHDCARGHSTDTIFDAARDYGIEPDEYEKNMPILIHATLGAEIARAEYCIADPDILNAIRYHTTGRAGMSLLEKIVYTADKIEPLRGEGEWLQTARKCAEYDINAAVLDILYRSVQELGEPHPNGIMAREYLINNLLSESEDIDI